MSIQLDWDIETEHEKQRKHREDEARRRKRRGAVLRLLLGVLVLLALMGGGVFAVAERIRQIEGETRQRLRETVEAEVAALRIGSANAFLDLQRSATEDWAERQRQSFQEYQSLKAGTDIRLTGNVIDIEVVDQRARVQVEEIIEGIPYVRTWFYWRYEDGWRHVPPDYTFWGEASVLDREYFAIRYREVDRQMAQDMAAELDTWLGLACDIVNCESLPYITIEIIANRLPEVTWVDAESWQMVVPSPYVERARRDMPFDARYQLQTANLLAERLVRQATGGMQPAYPADAYYLRSAVISWLVGRFVEINTNSFLIESLVNNYGQEALGRLLQELQPLSEVSVFSQVVGEPSLAQMNLDWRDLLTWRLVTEDELIRRGDEANWLSLYELHSEEVRQAAYARYNAGQAPAEKVVVRTEAGTSPEGVPLLRAFVLVGSGEDQREEQILFHLVDNVWRRAS